MGVFGRGSDDGAGGGGGRFRGLRVARQVAGRGRPFVGELGLRPVVLGAEDEDVGHDDFVRRHLLRVFEDGRRRFRVQSAELFVFRVVGFGFGGGGSGGGDARGDFGLFGLLEGLREGGLAGARRAAVGADLGPAFAEEVA